jgi:hypothetical protein
MKVTWKDGRLCAGTLFRALAACGLDPCHYRDRICNLWYDDGILNPNTVRFAKGAQPNVIALGAKVSVELRRLGIGHTLMTHPAARGKIRQTAAYFRHVRETIFGKRIEEPHV